MNKKVYCAGSIRGGRDDAALYRRMIAYINRTDRVLTEHVGDLSLSALENGPGHDREIYEQDTAWIRACDVVIAECTSPSLGVGYELAYAEALDKPCHVFFRPSRSQLSAMIAGNPWFHIHPYETEAGARRALDAILSPGKEGE